MIRRNFFYVFFLALIAFCSFSQVIAQDKVLVPEMIFGIKTIVDAQISPSGETVAFQVSRARRDDEGPGGAISEIWTMPTKGGQATRFTYNERSDRQIQWAKDGKSFAFISQRGASPIAQIYLISLDGGEARQISKAESSVTAFKWSPDGSKIAFLMADAKTQNETKNEKEGKDWVVVDKNYKYTRVYLL
ncbi:MAG: peptidase S9 prolyl oligopeptidase active site domain-containing protein, partial [bacterium]